MILAAALATGFLAGRLTWLLLRPTLLAPPFLTTNFRGAPVGTAAGVAVVVAAVVVEAARALTGYPPDAARTAVVIAVAGLGLLGLFDDLGGSGQDRGFKGHLRALLGGRLTTGGTKFLGGAAVAVTAVAVVAPIGPDRSAVAFLADGALVALAANLANLFDRAPGRTIKVSAVAYVALAAATRAPSELAGVAVTMGAALALVLDDLHERVMLGDAGANVVGGALGLGVVIVCTPGPRLAVLAVVAALNLGAELVSFSRVIDAVPPLRALDRAGRRPT